jgi:hypothetical protein
MLGVISKGEGGTRHHDEPEGIDKIRDNASTISRILNGQKLPAHQMSSISRLSLKDTQDAIAYLLKKKRIAPTSDGFQCLYYSVEADNSK